MEQTRLLKVTIKGNSKTEIKQTFEMIESICGITVTYLPSIWEEARKEMQDTFFNAFDEIIVKQLLEESGHL